MNSKSDHIIKFSKELLELGIDIELKTLKLILRMQEQDFKNYTDGVDSAVEFEKLLSKIESNRNYPNKYSTNEQ